MKYLLTVLLLAIYSSKALSYELVERKSSGGYDYILGMPANMTAQTPVVMLLHGCKMLGPEVFDLSEIQNQAEKHGAVIIIPSQRIWAHPINCWSFYNSENQTAGKSYSEIYNLVELIEDVHKDLHLKSDNYIAGLSSGAAQAMNLFACYPEVFKGAGIHSGVAYAAATGPMDATKTIEEGLQVSDEYLTQKYKECSNNAKGKKLFVIHGTKDTRVVPENGRAVVSQLLGRSLRDDDLHRVSSKSGKRSYKEAKLKSDMADILYWEVNGMSHKWSGSDDNSQYADPRGPEATAAMFNFLLN